MVDFGTYHHSSREQSERTRVLLRGQFSRIMRSLFPEDSDIKILDAGCGLGFLSYIAAITFEKSSVVGVDIFSHESLLNSSLEKAKNNMKELGLSQRVEIIQGDLTKLSLKNECFDLVISNLVFHNLGRERFKAYSEVWGVMRKGSFFVLGDIFFREGEDLEKLQGMFTLVKKEELHESGIDQYKIMVMNKP